MTRPPNQRLISEGTLRGELEEILGGDPSNALSPTGQVITGTVRASIVQTGATTTADRPDPAAAGVGASIFDTTLGRPVWSTGTAWVDASGAVV